MLKIAICDDEQVEILYLSGLINKWAIAENTPFQLLTFESAEQFLFTYEEDKSFDILLLDIEMSGMSGVDLARQIRLDNESVQIIFITGFPDYMSFGYDVAALHYLMKPVSVERFFAVLNRAVSQLSKQLQAILLPIDGEQVRLHLEDIIYIEAISHSLEIHMRDGIKHTLKMPLYHMESQLTPEFVHCHRSYLVNLRHVKKITRTDIIIDSGIVLPLSRRQYASVNKAMMQHLKGGISK